MDQQGRRGELSASLEQLARIGRCTIDEMNIALIELENTETANVKSNGAVIKVINRRMRKEEKSRVNNAKRQEKFRENGGGDPDRWTYTRARILLMDEKKCAYCGKKATTIDHIVPRSRGGNEDDNNLVACCKVCNTFKNKRTPIEAKMDFHPQFYRLTMSDLFGSNAGSNIEVTGRSQKSEVRSQKSEIQKKESTRAAPDLSESNLFRKPTIPTMGQVQAAFIQRGGTAEQAEKFYAKHQATGWYLNNSPIKSFASLVPGFISAWKEKSPEGNTGEKRMVY